MNEGNSSNTNHQHVFDVIPLDNADNFLKEDNVILLPLYSLKQWFNFDDLYWVLKSR